jgi:hypothetical protein
MFEARMKVLKRVQQILYDRAFDSTIRSFDKEFYLTKKISEKH